MKGQFFSNRSAEQIWATDVAAAAAEADTPVRSAGRRPVLYYVYGAAGPVLYYMTL